MNQIPTGSGTIREKRELRPRRICHAPARVARLSCAALLAFAVASTSPAFADLLHLKNGEELEGFYIREADGLVEFKLADGTDRKVPSVEVKRLQLGYTGVPLCYSTRAKPEEKICNVLLHEIRGEEMIIADQKGYVSLRSVNMYDVGFAELNRVGDFQKIAPLLTKNLKIRATRSQAPEMDPERAPGEDGASKAAAGETDQKPGEGEASPTDPLASTEGGENQTGEKNDIVEGSVAEIRGDSVLIRDESGELREIEDGRIQLVAFQGPPESERPRPPREFRYSDLYPGIPQMNSDQRTKGYALFGGFHFALFAVLWEFRAAQEASAAAEGDLSVLLFNNTSYLEEFERHQRNQMMFGLVAGIVYAWHLVDWFYAGNSGGPVGAQESKRPAILLDGYENRDGEYREAVYRLGLRMRF
ncbi:MAG: hypothetical protein RIF32_21085 [Leptospirales bacterium]